MTDVEPFEAVDLNHDGHAVGPDSAGPGELLSWARARRAIEGAVDPTGAMFLGTTRLDGRPHSAGIGALWHDGDFYFISGPAARKSRNLEANPAATLSIGAADMHLVLEGTAARVEDKPTLEALAAAYREHGWPAEVEGDAFTAPFCAPSAGPPPWNLYRFTFHTAFGVAAAEPVGATRWRFTR